MHVVRVAMYHKPGLSLHVVMAHFKGLHPLTSVSGLSLLLQQAKHNKAMYVSL